MSATDERYDFIVMVEVLGSTYEIDLSTAEGWEEWVDGEVMDEEEARNLAGRIAQLAPGESILLNGNEAEFVVRYSKVAKEQSPNTPTREESP